MASQPVQALDTLKCTGAYPKGARLFVEGEQARGVFVLCHGQAKLTASSAEGRSMIVCIAGPGEILGVSAAILGKPYEVSAEILEASQVSFLRRDDFLQLLSTYSEACTHATQQLSESYQSAQREIRSLGLAHNTSEKLAKLIIERSATGEETAQGIRTQILLTHEEIGQMIGTTRETVTRLLRRVQTQEADQRERREPLSTGEGADGDDGLDLNCCDGLVTEVEAGGEVVTTWSADGDKLTIMKVINLRSGRRGRRNQAAPNGQTSGAREGVRRRSRLRGSTAFHYSHPRTSCDRNRQPISRWR